jgi:hypothetical protein
MGGERVPWLEGYRIKIVDGNCLGGNPHVSGMSCPTRSSARARPTRRWQLGFAAGSHVEQTVL